MQNDDKSRSERRSSQLERLEDLHHYKVAKGDANIRGWEVRTADGVKVGKVESLIADTGAMKVRYFEVELDKHALNLDDKRYVILPIGTARLDDNDDCVLLAASSTVAELTQVSTIERVAVDREFDRDRELALRQRIDRDYHHDADREFYADPHYDPDRFFGSRRQ